MQRERSSDIRYERIFGRATFLGDNGDKFFSNDLRTKVLEMGWSQASPNPEKVAAKYGWEWTLKRYAECNFWTGYAWNKAQEINPELAEQMRQWVERYPGTKARGYDPKHVPESHLQILSPLSTPWGYAFPRILIEQLGRGEERSVQRIEKGLEILEDVLKDTETPMETTAVLAERLAREEAKPEALLGHLLAVKMEAEGDEDWTEYAVRLVSRFAPDLWKRYKQMEREERVSYGMIREAEKYLNR